MNRAVSNADAQDALDDLLNGFELWKRSKMTTPGWGDEDEAFARWVEASPNAPEHEPEPARDVHDALREALKLASSMLESREVMSTMARGIFNEALRMSKNQ